MKSKETFGAFDMAIGELLGDQFGTVGGGNDFPILDPPEDEEEIIPDEEEETTEEVETEDTVEIEEEVEETVEEEEDDDTDKTDEPITDLENLGELEPDIAAYVQEKLYEKLGWEPNEDEAPFEKIEDIIAYLEDIIEVNSKPKFASKEIEDLNSYISSGGNVRKYFEELYGEFSLDNIDLERESHQEVVVREQLKELGYSKEAIDKRVQRYMDTGILEDEAKEAAEFLQKNTSKKQEKLLLEQQEVQKQVQEQQQKFYEDVSSTIESLEAIKGIKLSKADKNKLVNYIFTPGSDGKTQYQKDYAKSFNNLIESAFFTMKGDSLVKGIKRDAESKATKNLKTKLATKTKRGRDSGESDNSSSGRGDKVLTAFSQLMRP